MTWKSPSSLWKPGSSIRFAPKRTCKLYPDIKLVESSHSLVTSSSPCGPSRVDGKSVTTHSAPAMKDDLADDTVSAQSKAAADQKKTVSSRVPKPTPSNSTFLCPGQRPQTNLAYKLSAPRYDAARDAIPNTPNSFWSHTLYEKTDDNGSAQKVKVHYCTSKHTVENICQRYFQNEPVLGFDMEWISFANQDSGPRQNVSLIQIASPSRIGLFHLALFPKDDFVSPTFRKIMEDSQVVKVGVNILADATRLRKVLGVNMAGIFEVSHLYSLVRYCKNRLRGQIPKSAVAMAKQVEECLGLPMYKAVSVRAGDWMLPLDSRQLHYAASDAYAGIQLYHVLEQHRLQLTPRPPRPHFAELRLPINRPDVDELDSGSSEDDLIDDSITDEDMLALEQAMKVDDLLSSPRESDCQLAGQPARDSRLSAADSSVEKFKALAPHRVAGTAALRAYYVWHNNEDLPPAEIASLLRDPPLRTNTVVTYILDVVTSEKLPYSKSRMAAEVLPLVHHSAVTTRYQELARSCNFIPST